MQRSMRFGDLDQFPRSSRVPAREVTGSSWADASATATSRAYAPTFVPTRPCSIRSVGGALRAPPRARHVILRICLRYLAHAIERLSLRPNLPLRLSARAQRPSRMAGTLRSTFGREEAAPTVRARVVWERLARVFGCSDIGSGRG
jgi:hypothetical protein